MLVSNKTLHKRIIVMMKIIVMIQHDDITIMNCLVIQLKNKRICALFLARTNGKKYSRLAK